MIKTDRFFLRPLAETDATIRYLSWLKNIEISRYICTAKRTDDLTKLKAYIIEKIQQPNSLFLGIFENYSGSHIGNIKYEPIDLSAKTAVMGILIGDLSWHSKGVAKEVIIASSLYLKKTKNIEKVLLGVDFDNRAAIRAYEKIGFVRQNKAKDDKSFFMELILETLQGED